MDPNAQVDRAVDGEGGAKLILVANDGQVGEVTRLLGAPGIDVVKADKNGRCLPP